MLAPLAFVLAAALIAPPPAGGGVTGPRHVLEPDSTPHKASWLLLPALFRTPETGVGGGGVVGWYPDGGVGARPTSHMVFATYTENRQIMLGLSSEAYLRGGEMKVTGQAMWQKYPDVFYGIGNDTPESSEEDFTPKTLLLDLTVEREVRPNVWAGVRAMVRNDDMVETESGGLLASGVVTGAEGGLVTGLGAVFRRDTRDTPFSTRSGSMVWASWTWHGNALGSDYDAWAARLDARAFRAVGAGVMAVHGFLQQAGGSSVPFTLMPRLGGSELLRGYRQGRFSDRHLAIVEAEVRHPLFWRFGGAAFAGVGDVASSWGGFRAPGEMERAWGLGLRVRLTEAGVPLRIDWAKGRRGSSGFYVTLGQAF